MALDMGIQELHNGAGKFGFNKRVKLEPDFFSAESDVPVAYTDANGKSVEVLQDPVDGWTYDDPQHPGAVLFHGKTCQELQTQSDGQVKIELGCATKVK